MYSTTPNTIKCDSVNFFHKRNKATQQRTISLCLNWFAHSYTAQIFPFFLFIRSKQKRLFAVRQLLTLHDHKNFIQQHHTIENPNSSNSSTLHVTLFKSFSRLKSRWISRTTTSLARNVFESSIRISLGLSLSVYIVHSQANFTHCSGTAWYNCILYKLKPTYTKCERIHTYIHTYIHTLFDDAKTLEQNFSFI